MVVAAPVADAAACDELRMIADELVCLRTPDRLRSASEWFEDFSVPGSDELRRLLEQARRPAPAADIGIVDQLRGTAADYDPVVRRAAETDVVLVGGASHGTHEFYAARAEMTRRLIAEHGYTVVAVEADWPDAYRVNRFVRGEGDDESAEEALEGFRRFPAWMWRNTAVAEFVLWLREHNDGLPPGATKVGFYGLDLYSLHTSMHEVIAYLEDLDPEAAERARRRYACFDHFGRDPEVYAYEAGLGGAESCERQAVQQLQELHRIAAEQVSKSGHAERTAGSTPSRTPASSSTPSGTTARCSAAASRRGTCATATWPTRSTRSSTTSGAPAARRRRRSCGSTTRTSATPAPPSSGRQASSTSASSCASATGATGR